MKSKFLMVISFLAILVSGYLLYLHYFQGSLEVCELGTSFSCDVVNKSSFSTIDGIFNHIFGTNFYFPAPNALLSIIFFGFVFALSYSSEKSFGLSYKKSVKLLRFMLILSLIYAAYLVYIEAYVLLTWCLFCLILDGLIIASLISTFDFRILK